MVITAKKESMSENERIKNALEVIHRYGGIDGEHHKQWVIDQVVRNLTGCPTVTKTSKDYLGNEYSYDTLGESDEYIEWVRVQKDGDDGPESYEWDEGIPP